MGSARDGCGRWQNQLTPVGDLCTRKTPVPKLPSYCATLDQMPLALLIVMIIPRGATPAFFPGRTNLQRIDYSHALSELILWYMICIVILCGFNSKSQMCISGQLLELLMIYMNTLIPVYFMLRDIHSTVVHPIEAVLGKSIR